MTQIHLRLWKTIFWTFILALVCGCTSVAPYRYTLTPKPPGHFYEESKCPKDATHEEAYPPDYDPKHYKNSPPSELPTCYSASVERSKHYTLFFIEFDEQGRFYDRKQLTALTQYLLQFKINADLKPEEKNCNDHPENNDGVSIVTFVHGWRNNARHDNHNVKLARDILEFTYRGENDGTQFNPSHCAREVVGVYVGWRGLSTTTSDLPDQLSGIGSPWEAISVWDRKNTAQNVAVGSVRELFSTLKVYQDERNLKAYRDGHPPGGKVTNSPCMQPKAEKSTVPSLNEPSLEDIYLCKPVRHLIVGHSYGALIVNNAVSQQLLESVIRGTFADPTKDCLDEDPDAGGMPGAAMVRSYADLIILLNPAVEGARYEPLQDASAARARLRWGKPGAYCPQQKPVLVVLTSEFDWATKWGFRLVRGVATVFENNSPQNDAYIHGERPYLAREEAKSSITTLGHNPRYHTHELMGWDTFVKTYRNGVPLATPGDKLDTEAAVALKNYALALENTCKPHPASVDDLSLEGQLNRLRCMSDTTANDIVYPSEQDNLVKLSEQEKSQFSYCASQLNEINLSRILLGRNSLQWPPGSVDGAHPEPYWTANFAGGSTLHQLRDYTPSRGAVLKNAGLDTQHSPASPLWNIYVKDTSIMKEHSDIKKARLLMLLQQLYHSVVIKSFQPKVLRDFGAIAEKNFEEKCLGQQVQGQ